MVKVAKIDPFLGSATEKTVADTKTTMVSSDSSTSIYLNGIIRICLSGVTRLNPSIMSVLSFAYFYPYMKGLRPRLC